MGIVEEMTDSQWMALVVTERVNSCLSLLGIFFVITTFLLLPSFDRPINWLIFFASWGNMGSNIASQIFEDGPLAGQASTLCQFQAFLVQMFLGVDCYWAFCRAIDVYLVFFCGYTSYYLACSSPSTISPLHTRYVDLMLYSLYPHQASSIRDHIRPISHATSRPPVGRGQGSWREWIATKEKTPILSIFHLDHFCP